MGVLLVYLLMSIMTGVTVSIYLKPDCESSGTDFVLMFLANIRDGTPLQVSLTTPLYNKEVQVRISTPVWNSAESVDKTITVNYGNRTVVNLPESLRVDISGKDYKTVLISADDVIIVYGSNIQKNTGDAFWVYPIDTLGLQYVSMTFKEAATYPSVAGCIAIHDDTEVNITHPVGLTVTSFTSNGHISIELDKYELFQIQAIELTGTVIQGSKTIACFSGSTFTREESDTSGDHISDQLKPVSRWSSYYVVAANPMYQHEVYKEFVRIVTYYEHANVSMTNHTTGTTTNVILNPTTFHEFYLKNGDAVTIFSDKVISVGQITSNAPVTSGYGDQRLLLSLGVDEYFDEYTFVFPGENLTEEITTGVFLVSKSSTKNTIQLDDAVINSNWTDISNSEYSCTWMTMGSGFHILKNSNGVFGGYLFGYGTAVQYGTVLGRVKYRQKIESQTGDIRDTLFTLVAENYIPSIDPNMTSYARSRIECLKRCPLYDGCGVVAFKKDVQNECTYYTFEAKCSKMISSSGYKLYAIANGRS